MSLVSLWQARRLPTHWRVVSWQILPRGFLYTAVNFDDGHIKACEFTFDEAEKKGEVIRFHEWLKMPELITCRRCEQLWIAYYCENVLKAQ